jgi:hypothetical protein
MADRHTDAGGTPRGAGAWIAARWVMLDLRKFCPHRPLAYGLGYSWRPRARAIARRSFEPKDSP